MTTYGELLDIATQDLATATVRQLQPAAQPDPYTAHAITDVAWALVHLGSTLGMDRVEHRTLRARLRAMGRVDCAQPSDEHQPTGVELDLVDAAAALRTASDLIASTGPLPDDMTLRLLDHSDWTRPRPEDLHSRDALTAGWGQLADLALITADLAPTLGHPELGAAADQAARAALQVPRPRNGHLPLQTAVPGWPLPLPRHPIPNEWIGRLTELSAIAWRLTQPPRPGYVHPIGSLRAIAEIGYHVHTRAADQPDTPAELRDPLLERAQSWSRIHVCLRALHTPTTPVPPGQRWSLLRTRELAAVGHLDDNDLLAGRTTLSLAAAYCASAVEHFTEQPGATLGPRIPTELRTTKRTRFAVLHREEVLMPAQEAEHLAALYRAAAEPIAKLRPAEWCTAPPVSVSL